jgi:hypothetical protein
VLAYRTDVTLEIFDVGGRRVVTLADGSTPGGPREIPWDLRSDAGRAVAPGIYFARLTADGEVSAAKIAVLR